MTEKDRIFINLFFEAVDENIDEVIAELKNAGINPEESEQKIMLMVKKQKAKLKIESGKQLKARVAEIIKLSANQTDTKVTEERYAIAARKLGAFDQNDIQSIKKDAELLEDIGKLLDKVKSDA